jgi:hypothetical protein
MKRIKEAKGLTSKAPTMAQTFKMLKLILSMFLFSILSSCSNSGKEKIVKETVDNKKDTTENHWALRFQKRHLSDKNNLDKEIVKYIDNTQEPYDTAIGDINGDNLLDLLLVTRAKYEDSLHTEMVIGNADISFAQKKYRRQLLILLKTPEDKYSLVCRNLYAIPYLENCGMSADSYGGSGIEKGEIIIIENCRSRYASISEFRFRYDKPKNNWYLDKIISEFSGPNNEDYSLDTFTNKNFGITPISSFDISNIKFDK